MPNPPPFDPLSGIATAVCVLFFAGAALGLAGKPLSATWIHPEPVQSYKLRKRG